MIATAKSGSRRDDVTVSDLDRAGLPEPCVIRVARLAAVSDTQIVRRLGDIPPKDRNATFALLRRYAG
jgi:hypothetical protein